jgi:hypothetical protein
MVLAIEIMEQAGGKDDDKNHDHRLFHCFKLSHGLLLLSTREKARFSLASRSGFPELEKRRYRRPSWKDELERG